MHKIIPDLGLDHYFLDMISKAKTTKKKNSNFNSMKIKNFYALQGNIERMKDNLRMGKCICRSSI